MTFHSAGLRGGASSSDSGGVVLPSTGIYTFEAGLLARDERRAMGSRLRRDWPTAARVAHIEFFSMGIDEMDVGVKVLRISCEKGRGCRRKFEAVSVATQNNTDVRRKRGLVGGWGPSAGR